MTLKIFSNDSTKSQKTVIVLIIILNVLITGGLGYVGWDSIYGAKLLDIIYTLIFIYYFSNIKYTNNTNFKSVIIILTFLPFLSSINAYLKYGQNFYENYRAMDDNSIWLLYFFYHKWKVKEATLLRLFLLLACFIFVVQVYQNIYPENAVFGVFDTEKMDLYGTVAEVRNGILRFRMHMNGYYAMPILLAFFCFIKDKIIDVKMIVIVVMMLVSIYLSLTRQVIVACLLAILMSFFIGKEHKFKDYFIMLLMVTGFYYTYDALFAELGAKTVEQATDDNVRVVAYNYFFQRNTEDIFAWLIGHGMAKCENFYSEISMMNDMRIFISDVGFIGKWFCVGLPYVLICYYFLYLLFWKFKKYTPTYIRLFVIFGIVMSVMFFPMYSPSYCLIWTIMAYITDLHINNSPLALETTKVNRIE